MAWIPGTHLADESVGQSRLPRLLSFHKSTDCAPTPTPTHTHTPTPPHPTPAARTLLFDEYFLRTPVYKSGDRMLATFGSHETHPMNDPRNEHLTSQRVNCKDAPGTVAAPVVEVEGGEVALDDIPRELVVPPAPAKSSAMSR